MTPRQRKPGSVSVHNERAPCSDPETSMPRRKKGPPEPVDPSVNPASPEATPPDTGPAFPIVAIGASAGGIEATTAVLKALPADTGMAFVVIQHLSPDHESLLAGIL